MQNGEKSMSTQLINYHRLHTKIINWFCKQKIKLNPKIAYWIFIFHHCSMKREAIKAQTRMNFFSHVKLSLFPFWKPAASFCCFMRLKQRREYKRLQQRSYKCWLYNLHSHKKKNHEWKSCRYIWWHERRGS